MIGGQQLSQFRVIVTAVATREPSGLLSTENSKFGGHMRTPVMPHFCLSPKKIAGVMGTPNPAKLVCASMIACLLRHRKPVPGKAAHSSTAAL